MRKTKYKNQTPNSTPFNKRQEKIEHLQTGNSGQDEISEKENTETLKVIYELARQITAELSQMSERQEKKVAILVSSITLLISAAVLSLPTGIEDRLWLISFIVIIALCVVTGIVSIVLCLWILSPKPYVHSNVIDAIYKKYMNATTREFYAQMVINYGDEQKTNQANFNKHVKNLNRVTSYLLPVLSIFLILLASLRVVYYIQYPNTYMNTNSTNHDVEKEADANEKQNESKAVVDQKKESSMSVDTSIRQTINYSGGSSGDVTYKTGYCSDGSSRGVTYKSGLIKITDGHHEETKGAGDANNLKPNKIKTK